MYVRLFHHLFFFFMVTTPTEIYTLSLHDALPISNRGVAGSELHDSLVAQCLGVATRGAGAGCRALAASGLDPAPGRRASAGLDRKSTRLNSSHSQISYAVFCLKKKKI